MTATIHPTALVDPDAQLGDGVSVGPFGVVEAGVHVGDGTAVAAHAVIYSGTRLGDQCSVGVGAVLGSAPQDLKYGGEPTVLHIGDRTRIREYVTVNRGTSVTGVTTIGSDCFLMAYVHIAHDCVVADNVVMANAVQLGGHVSIEAHVQVGGMTAIHQFTNVGVHAFVGGGSRVAQDIPPYAMAVGNPARLYGVNVEGLRRASFTAECRLALKRAYRLLFNSELARTAAVEQLRSEYPEVSEVQHLLDFVSRSQRGVLV